MTHRHLVVPTLITVIAIAGCGGSSSPTKALTRSELIAKADAICKRLDTKLTSMPVKNEEDVVRVLPQVANYQRQASSQLSRLTPPSQMASDWNVIVDGAKTLSGITVKLAEVAKAKDITAQHALIAESSKVQQHTVTVAKRDGFKYCSVTP